MTIDQAIDAALSAHRAGDIAQAQRVYREVLALQPGHPVALHYLGVAAHQVGQDLDALDLMRRSIAIDPANAGYHGNLADVLRTLRRFDEAESAVRRAIDLEPRQANHRNTLGLILLDAGNPEAAAAEFERAIALDPNDPRPRCNMGVVLHDLGSNRRALESLSASIRLASEMIEAHCNLADALSSLDRTREALEAADTAIRIAPDDPPAHLTRAHALLRAGRFDEGWAEYEWRHAAYPQLKRDHGVPEWNGQMPIEGRTILLYTEQGAGDTFMFARYVHDAAARGANVLIDCDPAVRRLLEASFAREARVRILQPGETSGAEMQCSLLSLPHRLALGAATLSARHNYIAPNPVTAQNWRDRVAAHHGFRVGIAWAGNPQHRKDRVRSCGLEALAPLAEAGAPVVFFSLQKGAGSKEAQTPPPGMTLVDLSADLTDFEDTAGLISALDLVISIDSAVAHLAGAMGKETWTLLPVSAEWRWFDSARSNSPWYPTMKLFRRGFEDSDGWRSVAKRVATELKRRAAESLV